MDQYLRINRSLLPFSQFNMMGLESLIVKVVLVENEMLWCYAIMFNFAFVYL